MKDSNMSNINLIRGMLPKEYLEKCSLRQKNFRIIYQHLITLMPGGNKKLYVLNQTCSCKLLLKYFVTFYYNQALKYWHIFNCRLVAVVGTSRNMNFSFRMLFIFYSAAIRRILKLPFSSFVVYFNLKLLFWYFLCKKLLTYQITLLLFNAFKGIF